MSGLLGSLGSIGPTGPTGPTGPAGPAGASGGAVWSMSLIGDLLGTPQNAVVGQYLIVIGGDSVKLPTLTVTSDLLVIANLDVFSSVAVSSDDALVNNGVSYSLPSDTVGIFISNPLTQNWNVFLSI